ncbi:MAG: 1-acyl-sn-glycerol-3-phosphate acyltransferase [Nitrospinae bacterium]|nr:1-acyl-sn-glycerol-3-phosphate acyltransferase [Nitrospinota bacterium]
MVDFIRSAWRCLGMFISDVFWRVLFRARVFGVPVFPQTGGALVACNHLSNFDPMFTGWNVVNGFGRFSLRRIWIPAKEELFFFPLGPIIRSWGAFPVRRKAHDLKSMALAAERAKTDVVMIYPEGTRSKTGELGPGKAGVGKIIYDSRATVIPTVVFNTRYCWPQGSWFPRLFVPLRFVWGKPLDLSRHYAMPDCKETSQAIVDEVMRAIGELQKEYAHLDMNYNKPK